MTSPETTKKFGSAIDDYGLKIEGAVRKQQKITKTARGEIKVSGGEFDLLARSRNARASETSHSCAPTCRSCKIQAKSGGKVRLTDLIADREFLLGTQNLIDGQKELDDIIRETKKDYRGFMDEQQGKRLKSWQSKLDDLSNSFSALQTTIGNALASAMTPLTQKMRELTVWVKDPKAHPQVNTERGARHDGVRWAERRNCRVKYSFLNLKVAALASFNVMKFFIATPLGLALTAIGAAVLLIWTNWDKIKEILPNVTKRFEETVTSIKDKLLNTDWIQVGRDMISSLWTGMKEWLNRILAGVGEYVDKIKGIFVGSAQASTGGSATSMSGSTGGGSSYTDAAERMRRLSGGGASGATPGATTGGGSSPHSSGAATPSRGIGGVSGMLSGARARGGASPSVAARRP